MTYEELRTRAIDARSRGDENYWEGWMADLEWSQFVNAWALVQDWDGQLKEMMRNGYLQEHPLYEHYCPEAQLEGRAT